MEQQLHLCFGFAAEQLGERGLAPSDAQQSPPQRRVGVFFDAGGHAVEQGQQEQGQQGGGNQAADDHDGQGTLDLRAWTLGEE